MPLQQPQEIFQFDKYVEAEKELAGLRGWSNIRVYKIPPFDLVASHAPRIVLVSSDNRESIPRWARDNADCFVLGVECGIWVKEWASSSGKIEIEAKYLLRDRFPTYYTDLADHDDKEAAFRYATVLAAIGRARKMLQS